MLDLIHEDSDFCVGGLDAAVFMPLVRMHNWNYGNHFNVSSKLQITVPAHTAITDLCIPFKAHTVTSMTCSVAQVCGRRRFRRPPPPPPPSSAYVVRAFISPRSWVGVGVCHVHS